MKPLDLDAPQLGEYAWHAFTDDHGIAEVSSAHRDRILSLVRKHAPSLDWAGARVLEVGAYRHYTAHLLAAQFGCRAAVTDISAAALRDGTARAAAQNVRGSATMVAADFHDLPFSDDYFDVIFIASAVHHTRHPELVLREMLRTLRPSGILILDNEPCARTCCFHAFVTNRQDSFTPFEAGLHQEGLITTISSPFWGARAEQLFGMVENDRIPLSLFMEVLTGSASVLERRLDVGALVGPLEKQLLQLSGKGQLLREQTTQLLRSAVAKARALHGEKERLLGYRLPTECEIHEVAGRVASLLERRPHAGSDEEWQAELFGAALSIAVRKNPRGAAPVTEMFRRPVSVEADGLVRERDEEDSVASRLGNRLLPDIFATSDEHALDDWFPPDQWRWFREQHGGISMINLAARGQVRFAATTVRTLLLVRYYAVAGDTPYRVRIWAGGRLLADQLIVLQESRLARAVVPIGCSELVVETCGLDEAPVALPWNVRIGVLQLFATG